MDDAFLEDIRQLLNAVYAEISKVYIGPLDRIERLFIALLARGHLLIEGVPGVAKTTLVKAFAQSLGCHYRRIQFTPDLLPGDITGTYVFDRENSQFVLRSGPIFAQILLGDEINRAPAKTQSALLEAMQEGQVTVEGQTQPLPKPFLVLATQNPVEQEGVYLLPEAQLDRFLFKLSIDYPSEHDELEILKTYLKTQPPVQPVLSPDTILKWIHLTQEVSIHPELMQYIVQLVRATRSHPHVRLGASPRASLALMNAARARALLQGRPFVIPDDIRILAQEVLTHRILVKPEAEISGFEPKHVVQFAIRKIPYAPRS